MLLAVERVILDWTAGSSSLFPLQEKKDTSASERMRYLRIFISHCYFVLNEKMQWLL